MTDYPAALEAELSTKNPLLFGAIKIDIAGGAISLLDGASEVTFGGDTYRGADDIYGTLAEIDGIRDGVGDQAPRFRITLNPKDGGTAAQLASPANQGAVVTAFLGAIDKSDGSPIDTYTIAAAEVEVVTPVYDRKSLTIEIECTSPHERFFEADDSLRLDDANHKSIFADETAFGNVHDLDRKDGWGVADGAPASVVNNGIYGGTGGGTAGYNRPRSYLVGL